MAKAGKIAVTELHQLTCCLLRLLFSRSPPLYIVVTGLHYIKLWTMARLHWVLYCLEDTSQLTLNLNTLWHFIVLTYLWIRVTDNFYQLLNYNLYCEGFPLLCPIWFDMTSILFWFSLLDKCVWNCICFLSPLTLANAPFKNVVIQKFCACL